MVTPFCQNGNTQGIAAGVLICSDADTNSPRKVLESSLWARHFSQGPARRHGETNVPKNGAHLWGGRVFGGVRAPAPQNESPQNQNQKTPQPKCRRALF